MAIVLPIVFRIAYSHDRMVKKKTTVIKSAMCSSALFSSIFEVNCVIYYRKASMMAFCDLALGDTLIIALIRSWMFVLNPDLLELSWW